MVDAQCSRCLGSRGLWVLRFRRLASQRLTARCEVVEESLRRRSQQQCSLWVGAEGVEMLRFRLLAPQRWKVRQAAFAGLDGDA